MNKRIKICNACAFLGFKVKMKNLICYVVKDSYSIVIYVI